MTLHEKVVLSAYTGILMCDMSEVHRYIEKLLGRPVWTHELASEALWSEIKEKAKPDFHKIIEPINQKIIIDQLAARIPHTDQATTHEKEHSTMTINEYQALALRTESRITTDPVPYIRVLEGLMGLNGEAGEAIDLMKKVLFQGHEFDREHMAKELGDIAWYLAVSADAIGYDLESILQMNVDKLRTRYPDGFSTEQSLHRSANDI